MVADGKLAFREGVNVLLARTEENNLWQPT
jgi:hypothetical protein